MGGVRKIKHPQPLTLIILDGYGLSEETAGNAVAAAKTPTLDQLFREYPMGRLDASGEAVGLPAGQMGNSEVGHLNLGAGRIIYQDYTRISKAIQENLLGSNPTLNQAIDFVRKNDSSLHLLGLLSPGGVHSHQEHLYGLLEMAREKGVERVYVHAIMDGRDTPPESGAGYMEELQAKMQELGIGKVATVSGRYYTMDRDHRWERTERAYNLIVLGQGVEDTDPVQAIEKSYQKQVSDEFIMPVVITEQGEAVATVQNGDAVIFFNFRADRARQITRALAIEHFEGFQRPAQHPGDLLFICMTEYDEEFALPIAFPPVNIKNTLGEVISKKGLRQLRMAETEKYAHVTFFFNGGIEASYPGEERKLIPSPQVATYDLKPEMSAYQVTTALLEELDRGVFDVIILNFANPDMVGHTGIMGAAVKAIEAVDQCLAQIIPAILEQGGQILLTADHGNSEKMIDDRDGGPFTAHTTNPVPLLYIGGPAGVGLKSGKLADIAPTMLNILGIEIPVEMTGEVLLKE